MLYTTLVASEYLAHLRFGQVVRLVVPRWQSGHFHKKVLAQLFQALSFTNSPRFIIVGIFAQPLEKVE